MKIRIIDELYKGGANLLLKFIKEVYNSKNLFYYEPFSFFTYSYLNNAIFNKFDIDKKVLKNLESYVNCFDVYEDYKIMFEMDIDLFEKYFNLLEKHFNSLKRKMFMCFLQNNKEDINYFLETCKLFYKFNTKYFNNEFVYLKTNQLFFLIPVLIEENIDIKIVYIYRNFFDWFVNVIELERNIKNNTNKEELNNLFLKYLSDRKRFPRNPYLKCIIKEITTKNRIKSITIGQLIYQLYKVYILKTNIIKEYAKIFKDKLMVINMDNIVSNNDISEIKNILKFLNIEYSQENIEKIFKKYFNKENWLIVNNENKKKFLDFFITKPY